MVRRPSYDRNGVKKGLWSQEEDDKLKGYIQRYGPWNWNELPRFAGLSRCGKSCRLRWLNYLRPNLRRGNFTQEEDELVIKLQDELGNKWCKIASRLPGRTDNEIKNYWHSKLKKRMKQNIKTPEEENDQSRETSERKANQNKEGQEPKTVFVDVASLNILESSKVSLEPYSSTKELSVSSDHALSSGVNLAAAIDSVANSSDIFAKFTGDFWTEPFLADSFYQYDDFPSTMEEGVFTFPYISYGDDVVDLFYQMIPEYY